MMRLGCKQPQPLTLPQGQAPREGLQTDARKREQIEAMLRSHVSLLCIGRRYIDITDERFIAELMARFSGKWG